MTQSFDCVMPPVPGVTYKLRYGLFIADKGGKYELMSCDLKSTVIFRNGKGASVKGYLLSNGKITSQKPTGDFYDPDLFVAQLEEKLKYRNLENCSAYFGKKRAEFYDDVVKRIIMDADYTFDLHPPTVAVVGNGDLWFVLPAETQADVDRILEDLRNGIYDPNKLKRHREYWRLYKRPEKTKKRLDYPMVYHKRKV